MISSKLGIQGYFKIDAISPNGKKRNLAPWQPNLVTDVGLDMPGQYANVLTFLNRCRLGTGSTPPAVTDTALVNQITSVAANTVNTNVGAATVPPYYKFWRCTFIFTPGMATGNISELGLGPASTGDLFSRALIKDTGGTPTTITVLSDEQLNVVYEFRVYPNTTDWSGVVNIAGVDYTFTIRPAFISEDDAGFETNPFIFGGTLRTWANANALGAVTNTVTPASGASSSTTTNTNAAYVPGTYFRDTTFSMALSQFNNGVLGVRAFDSSAGVTKWQGTISPGIPKDNTKIMTLKFRLSWARYTIP